MMFARGLARIAMVLLPMSVTAGDGGQLLQPQLASDNRGVGRPPERHPPSVTASVFDGHPIQIVLEWTLPRDGVQSQRVVGKLRGKEVFDIRNWRVNFQGICKDPETTREQLVFLTWAGGTSDPGTEVFVYATRVPPAILMKRRVRKNDDDFTPGQKCTWRTQERTKATVPRAASL